MRAERFAQRLVQQVRGGMVGADGGAPVLVDAEDAPARPARSRPVASRRMARTVPSALRCVSEHPEARTPFRLDQTRVADLTARFAVEGRLVDDHGAALACLEGGHLGAVLDQRQNRPSAASAA
jgi:hypothetical protein